MLPSQSKFGKKTLGDNKFQEKSYLGEVNSGPDVANYLQMAGMSEDNAKS